MTILFSDWLKKARRASNLTLQELGELSGVSHNYISILERNLPHHKTGKVYKPSRVVVIKLANALDVNPNIPLQLVGYANEEDPDPDDVDQNKLLAFYGDMNPSDREAVLILAQALWQKRRERELIQDKTLPKQESTDE